MRRLLVLISLLAPIAGVFAAAVGFGLVYGRDDLRVYNDYSGSGSWVWRVWAVVLPGVVVSAWAACEVACLLRRRPPRLLDVRVRKPIRRVLAGVFIGLAALALSIILAAYFDNRFPDAVLLASGTFGVVFVSAMCWPRVRPLHCPGCNYDLRSSLSPASLRCPECGLTAISS